MKSQMCVCSIQKGRKVRSGSRKLLPSIRPRSFQQTDNDSATVSCTFSNLSKRSGWTLSARVDHLFCVSSGFSLSNYTHKERKVLSPPVNLLSINSLFEAVFVVVHLLL